MATATGKFSSTPKIDAAALFKKLGLTVADERPIMQGWREANAQWRRQRREQIALHAQRVRERLLRIQARRAGSSPCSKHKGRRRAVWCVELRRRFESMSEAGRFVNRKANHISQALSRGGMCGPYHWAECETG